MMQLPSNIRVRCLAWALGAIVLFPALASAPLLAAQGAFPPIDVYRSPQFGYLFWWDANEWEVQGESSEPGLDWIQLANQTTIVDVWGYEAAGETPQSCLAGRLEQIAGSAELTRYDEVAQPEHITSFAFGGGDATTELVLGFENGNGEQLFAVRERCSAIIPGRLFLVTSEWTIAGAFNANVDAGLSDGYGTDGVLLTLTLPRYAWSFDPSTGRVDYSSSAFNVPDQQIFAADGSETGIITDHDFYCQLSLPQFTVLDHETAVIENTNPSNLVLAPEDFVTADPNGSIVGPAFHRWLYPQVGNDQSVVLRQGEVAIVQLEATGTYPNEVYFVDQWGNGIFLFTPLGCQGGAAAPIRIDMS